MTFHTYILAQHPPYHISTSYALQFLRYNPHKIFKLKVKSNQGHNMTLQS